MPITLNFKEDQKTALVSISGSFTFESHVEFRKVKNSILERQPPMAMVNFDFNQCTYLDSAALGMLLLFRENYPHAKISLINTKGTVKAVFDVANFSKLFDMS